MSLYNAMAVTVPEGTHGRVTIKQFTVTALDSALDSLRGRGTHALRAVAPGTYTGLYIDGEIWMSDTYSERNDHFAALAQARDTEAKRVLVNGLGLGMAVNALLTLKHVEHIDVVEHDADVIALSAAHYAALAASLGKTVTVHHADAFAIEWPSRTRWDLAWHDIWQSLDTSNLPEMTKLHRKYRSRVTWQESWCRSVLQAERRRERALENRMSLWARGPASYTPTRKAST